MFLEDDISVSKVKLTYHVPKEDRDLEEEDEYSGEIIKHISGDPLIDAEALYMSDMYFTDGALMKGIFTIFRS